MLGKEIFFRKPLGKEIHEDRRAGRFKQSGNPSLRLSGEKVCVVLLPNDLCSSAMRREKFQRKLFVYGGLTIADHSTARLWRWFA